ELPPVSLSISSSRKSSTPALARRQAADSPEMPPPTISTPGLRTSAGAGKPPSRRRCPCAWDMPSSSPGGNGGFPAGAHPAMAAAPTAQRNSRRLRPGAGSLVLVKLPEREADRQLRPQPAEQGTAADQRRHFGDTRRMQRETGAVK